MSTTIDQQFVEFIVKTIVSNPDAVEVKRTIDEKGVLLELTVDPQDLGRVIGKRGIGAQSLRTLLRALGTKNDARYNLKIVDVGEGGATPSPRRSEETTEDSTPAEESAEEQKATTNDESASDDTESVDEDNAQEETEEESRASRTRKELEDLDDLDI